MKDANEHLSAIVQDGTIRVESKHDYTKIVIVGSSVTLSTRIRGQECTNFCLTMSKGEKGLIAIVLIQNVSNKDTSVGEYLLEVEWKNDGEQPYINLVNCFIPYANRLGQIVFPTKPVNQYDRKPGIEVQFGTQSITSLPNEPNIIQLPADVLCRYMVAKTDDEAMENLDNTIAKEVTEATLLEDVGYAQRELKKTLQQLEEANDRAKKWHKVADALHNAFTIPWWSNWYGRKKKIEKAINGFNAAYQCQTKTEAS